MEERFENEAVFNKNMFNETFKKLKKKGGDKYKSILMGGDSLLNALYKVYEVVWNYEKKPDSWCNTIVLQLDKKGKKDKSDLESKRFIHTKEPICKFFSHILTTAVKPTITENISTFQIGTIPKHRAQEHLFTVRSFVLMVEKNKESVAIQILDLKKYFDFENLLDV